MGDQFRAVILIRAFNYLIMAALSVSVGANYCLAQPAAYLDKVSSTPDFTQTNARGHFPEGGKNYCAPVAVSNSFVWLAKHGYPKLLPALPLTGNTQQDDRLTDQQIAMIDILSNREYMDTRAEEGTEVSNVLRGIKRYILEHGYSIKTLNYQGFRLTNPEFESSSRYPRLASIKQGIAANKSGVWLNIGWYKCNPQNFAYMRQGGHWVSLVGYGVDAQNQKADDIFIVHNPSQLAGLTFHNDFIKLVRIDYGVLVSPRGFYGFPRPAPGFYKIVSGMPPIHGCNTAVLEGVIFLELN